MSTTLRRWAFPATLAAAVLAAGGYALWRGAAGRSPATAASRPAPPPPPSKESRLGISAPPGAPPKPPEQILVDRWVESIRSIDRDGVMRGEATFRQREDSSREPLVNLARQHSEPRVRAFAIAVLGRFQKPPPEDFFLACLDDSNEYSRENALIALEKFGTAASLDRLARTAREDSVERLRALAERTAQAIRAR